MEHDLPFALRLAAGLVPVGTRRVPWWEYPCWGCLSPLWVGRRHIDRRSTVVREVTKLRAEKSGLTKFCDNPVVSIAVHLRRVDRWTLRTPAMVDDVDLLINKRRLDHSIVHVGSPSLRRPTLRHRAWFNGRVSMRCRRCQRERMRNKWIQFWLVLGARYHECSIQVAKPNDTENCNTENCK